MCDAQPFNPRKPQRIPHETRIALAPGCGRGLQRRSANTWRFRVRELVRYLMENAYIDFGGDLSMEKVRELLRDDDTREARSLLAKLIDDKGVDDLMITIADCLKDHIRVGITEDTIREQLSTYSES
jgi:hypothetical protein